MKQALCCSGANVTDKHVTDVSMCALFLLEAAKRCDKVFGVPPQSTAHTVRSSKSDVQKICQHLTEKGIIKEDNTRKTPAFKDPTVSGLDTLSKGDWIQKKLQKLTEDTPQSSQSYSEVDIEVDIDYELADLL